MGILIYITSMLCVLAVGWLHLREEKDYTNKGIIVVILMAVIPGLNIGFAIMFTIYLFHDKVGKYWASKISKWLNKDSKLWK
jgi:hypothetical protein